MSENNIKKENSLLNLLLFRFIPYWPLFVILLVFCITGALLYIQYAVPVYEASATMLIKDEKKGVDDSRMMESLNIYTSKKIVENEIEVIRSRAIMKEVVNRLHLYAPVREKGRIRSASSFSSSPIIVEVRNPDTIATSLKVYFTFNALNKQVIIDKKAYSLNEWVGTKYGDLKFSTNPYKTAQTNKQFYFTLLPPKNVTNSLVKNLTVKPASKLSTVVNLSFKNEDPLRAEQVLNEVIESYNRAAVYDKNSLAANTLAFVDERLRYVTKSLDSIENKIQKYKSQQGVTNISTQGELFLRNVSENDQQIGQIGMQLAVLNQVENYVVSKDTKSGIVPSTLGVNDPILSNLLQKLSESELQHQKLKQTVGDNNTMLVTLKSEIEQIRPSILENIRNQRSSLQASRGNLNATNNKFSSMLRTFPQKERELLEISRQQSIKNDVYSFLLQKREETALSFASTVADSRVVDRAQTSIIPISPKRNLIFAIAIALAFILGIGIVSAREILPNKILFRSDIEKFTKIPIAAEIATVKHKHDLVIEDKKNMFIAEQFRQLRAAIGLYGKPVRKKKLLVTSSIPEEGKSFVTANLALSLAISGKKVIVLDADLRNPHTSAIFGLKDNVGFAEYLEGNVHVNQLIKETDRSNLFLIPAGKTTNNPTELLLNGNLEELFTYLEQTFDYILVDTAPIDPVTDAYVLSKFCDKTLFVIRHGYTPKTMVQLLDDNNKIKALRNIAIVFNGIRKRGFIKSSYGYGYGYGYEYVYKERSSKMKVSS